jgi:hypothetical protein
MRFISSISLVFSFFAAISAMPNPNAPPPVNLQRALALTPESYNALDEQSQDAIKRYMLKHIELMSPDQLSAMFPVQRAQIDLLKQEYSH